MSKPNPHITKLSHIFINQYYLFTYLFRPSTTKYRPVPPYTDQITPSKELMPPSTDQVQPSTNQYCLILTQSNQVPISTAYYWPSTPKYQPYVVPALYRSSTTPYKPKLERISNVRSLLINLTSYQCTSGVEFDQGYLLFCLTFLKTGGGSSPR